MLLNESRSNLSAGMKRKLKPGISACIITFNEEKRLPRCLHSLSFVDEIIILDSYSRDGTVQIAKKYGAKIYQRNFTGYVDQKNHAIQLASFEWILVIDADEVVTDNLKNEIIEIIKNRKVVNYAYKIPRITYYLGKWIKHSGWYPDYTSRLFQNGTSEFKGGKVHERLCVNGKTGKLKNRLEHYSYQNISQHLLRIEEYSTLIAMDKHENGEKASVPWAVAKSITKFVITYFLKFGFLDGSAGLVISVMAGYYNFLKYAKLWELQRGAIFAMPHRKNEIS